MTARKSLVILATAAVIVLGIITLGPYLVEPLMRTDATIYAQGFSEKKFQSIHKGMSKAEVLRILGRPLAPDKNHDNWLPQDGKTWAYSSLAGAKIPMDDRVTDTWYVEHRVVFDESGRVAKTVRYSQQFE